MNDGLPLLRPLWMLDPTDPACLYVNDEFSIGEELIVAPILMKGQFQREGRETILRLFSISFLIKTYTF